MREFIVIIITVTIVVIIKFVYDLLIKPIFMKQNKQWHQAIDEATYSRENLRKLLKLLLQSDNKNLKQYYEQLRVFDKKELTEIEIEKFNTILKKLKK